MYHLMPNEMKKVVFTILIALAGFSLQVSTQPLSAQTSKTTHDLTYQEKYQVCSELENRRIIDLNTALELERTGILTIEKLESGVYRVLVPGIGTAILIEENI